MPKRRKAKITRVSEQIVEKVREAEARDEVNDDQQLVYEVERLLDRKVVRGVVQYKVRWNGYDENWDTWEEEANIHSQELIDDYEREHGHVEVKKARKQGPVAGKMKLEEAEFHPKDTYFVEENGGNKTVKEILGIFRHENAPGRKIVAFVSYDDGTFEFVPTEVLAQIVHAAQKLVHFYEQRVELEW